MSERIITLALIFLGLQAWASPDALRARADSAYVAKEFALAAEQYEQVLALGYTSAEVLYNLGNVYFRMGEVPKAVLQYERALRLSPADEDIIMNLRLANLQVKDKIEVLPEVLPVRIWNRVLSLLSMDHWAWVSIIGLLLTVVCVVLYFTRYEPRVRMVGFFGGILMLMLLGLGLSGALHQRNVLMNDDRAVIFTPTLNAHAAPDAQSGLLFVVHQGTVVQVTQELNGWYRIRLKDGNVGWVTEGSFERI
jgi:tetratricopeptide (TPR) repeat protein